MTNPHTKSKKNHIKEKGGSTLSDRIVHAINMKGVTQAELARQVGVKPQVIHYLCNSNSKKSGFTYEIAEALNINSLWLACGEGAMELEDDVEVAFIKSQKRIPVLDCRQIKQMANHSSGFDEIFMASKEWVLTSTSISEDGFAFRLVDKSLYPRFDHNTVVLIDPQRNAKNMDFVIIYLSETDDIVLRQFECKDNVILLKPMNTLMYKVIEKNTNDVILGVMVEARWEI